MLYENFVFSLKWIFSKLSLKNNLIQNWENKINWNDLTMTFDIKLDKLY